MNLVLSPVAVYMYYIFVRTCLDKTSSVSTSDIIDLFLYQTGYTFKLYSYTRYTTSYFTTFTVAKCIFNLKCKVR